MRSKLAAAFAAGMFFAVLIAAVAFGVFIQLEGNAQAQSSGWTVKYLPQVSSVEDLEAWVSTVPSTCDIVPSTQKDLFFVRCK